jgi:DNA replication protein DnaC
MYSICLSKDDVLKNVLELADENSIKLTSTADEQNGHDNDCLPWKAAFQKVARKLCLAQVSEDAFDKGATLLGREREQQIITNFLRSAIRSTNRSTWDGSKCPSMFIAGPPGTGKTVSVCSIISKLRHEQIDGKIPRLRFLFH